MVNDRDDRPRRGADSGLFPVLRSIATAPREPLSFPALRLAIDAGIGALAHYLYNPTFRKARTNASSTLSKAADTAARMLTAQMLDGLVDVLRTFGPRAADVIVLKGMATSLRHYPEPHLRTMGDIDLLVPRAYHDSLADALRALGYHQVDDQPPGFFTKHHHSAPFFHPIRQIWIELHTSLLPPWSHARYDPCFEIEQLDRHTVDLRVGNVRTRCLDDTLHLVFTCEHWIERFDQERGLVPLVDVLMLHRHSGIDWDAVLASVRGGRAADSVGLVTDYLFSRRLMNVPRSVRDALLREARGTNTLTRSVLHNLIDRYLVRRNHFGRALSENNVSLTWAVLLDSRSPARNLTRLPLALMFPPDHPKRFHPSLAATRLRSLLRANR